MKTFSKILNAIQFILALILISSVVWVVFDLLNIYIKPWKILLYSFLGLLITSLISYFLMKKD